MKIPHPCRLGNRLCGKSASSCAGSLLLPPDAVGICAGRDAASSVAAGANR